MALSTAEKLAIAYDMARGEMKFKIEDVEFIEQALIRAKAIEEALVLISAQRTCAELAGIGVLSDSFNRATMLDEIILYARKTLKGEK